VITEAVTVVMSCDATAFSERLIRSQLLLLRFIAGGVPEGLWEVFDLLGGT
jgi:hypothetical protein